MENKLGKRVFLFAGSPKTGSTSIQYFFRDHETDLIGAGIKFLPRWVGEKNVHEIHKRFVRLRKPDVDHSVTVRKAKAAIEAEYADVFQSLLISNESSFGEPFYEDNPGFFPMADTVLARIAEIFSDYQLHIVLMVRSYDKLITSYYRQAVRMGSTLPFDTYVRLINHEDLNWPSYVQKIRAAFPHADLRIVKFEDFCLQPQHVMQRMCKGIIPLKWPDEGDKYVKNQSGSAVSIQMIRGFNRAVSVLKPDAIDRLKWLRKSGVKSKLYPVLEYLIPGPPLQLDAQKSTELNQLYARHCQELGL